MHFTNRMSCKFQAVFIDVKFYLDNMTEYYRVRTADE